MVGEVQQFEGKKKLPREKMATRREKQIQWELFPLTETPEEVV